MSIISTQAISPATQAAPAHAGQTGLQQSQTQPSNSNAERANQLLTPAIHAIGQTVQQTAPQAQQRALPLPNPAAFGPEPHPVRAKTIILGPEGEIREPPSIKRQRKLALLARLQQSKARIDNMSPDERARIANRQAIFMAAMGLPQQ